MRRTPPFAGIWIIALLAMVPLAFALAEDQGAKLEAQLIWGTNEATPPPDKHYSPVQPDTGRHLKDLPFKWANYFEVHRTNFVASTTAVRNVALSPKCELAVKDSGKTGIEITLIGKGKEVFKQTQALPKGEMLVIGGNAPNATTWLVVLKRVE